MTGTDAKAKPPPPKKSAPPPVGKKKKVVDVVVGDVGVVEVKEAKKVEAGTVDGKGDKPQIMQQDAAPSALGSAAAPAPAGPKPKKKSTKEKPDAPGGGLPPAKKKVIIQYGVVSCAARYVNLCLRVCTLI